jgi:multiple sugar transport system permease protein
MRYTWKYYLPLIPFLIFAIFPFYWVILASLKQNMDLYSLKGNPFWFNASPTLAHFHYLFTKTMFLRWFGNQIFVSIFVVLITIITSVLGGYSLSRLHFPGGNLYSIGIFLSYLVPPALLFIPLSQVMAMLHLTDSLWSLIFIYPTITVPFSTWFMISYFRGIPRALDDAAMVDGCSRLGLIWRVIVPLSLPGIISVSLYTLVMTWHEILYVMTFISSSALKTVPAAAISDLILGDVYFWGELMSAVILGCLPIVLIFAFLSRYFVAGITRGAIK